MDLNSEPARLVCIYIVKRTQVCRHDSRRSANGERTAGAAAATSSVLPPEALGDARQWHANTNLDVFFTRLYKCAASLVGAAPLEAAVSMNA